MIRIEHLSKTYGQGETQVRALKNINMVIEEGEFVAVVGPSGSGKSTFLLTLGGLIQPSEGKVYVQDLSMYDQNVTERALLRRHVLGFMFQTFNLIPYLTALDNVQVALCVAERAQKVQLERAKALLERVGLQDRMFHRPAALSVGERQRVALARALANQPSIILADEPTGNLDPKCAAEVFEYLQQLNQEGYTTVMVTHDHQAARLAHRQLEIVDGRLVESPRTRIVGIGPKQPNISA